MGILKDMPLLSQPHLNVPGRTHIVANVATDAFSVIRVDVATHGGL